MWYLIVSIPDLCTLTYFDTLDHIKTVKESVLLCIQQIANWSVNQHILICTFKMPFKMHKILFLLDNKLKIV